jgi:4-hydroxy-tetrahydrodipicolinate reductase
MSRRVIINGASGKMGLEVIKAIQQEPEFELVGKLYRDSNLANAIQTIRPDIVIDFTSADVAFNNCETIIKNGAHPVIGTTGFHPHQIIALQELCAIKELGGIIAPNFSIGAVLLMRYAKEIGRYFNAVEIIEFHHNEKVDAPSGTAIKTAEMISANREQATISPVKENEIINGARGAIKDNIHIHSVRLPGLVAHEEVIFGSTGQTLTLRHDTYHREAFMPGVLLACHKVMGLKTLIYGLDNLL